MSSRKLPRIFFNECQIFNKKLVFISKIKKKFQPKSSHVYR